MKFKKGDRVTVYNAEIRSFHDEISAGSEWGPYVAIVEEFPVIWGTIPGYLKLRDFRGKERFAHPKQCRRFRK